MNIHVCVVVLLLLIGLGNTAAASMLRGGEEEKKATKEATKEAEVGPLGAAIVNQTAHVEHQRHLKEAEAAKEKLVAASKDYARHLEAAGEAAASAAGIRKLNNFGGFNYAGPYGGGISSHFNSYTSPFNSYMSPSAVLPFVESGNAGAILQKLITDVQACIAGAIAAAGGGGNAGAIAAAYAAAGGGGNAGADFWLGSPYNFPPTPSPPPQMTYPSYNSGYSRFPPWYLSPQLSNPYYLYGHNGFGGGLSAEEEAKRAAIAAAIAAATGGTTESTSS